MPESIRYASDVDEVSLRNPHALVAFGGWVDAGSGGTGGVRHLIGSLPTRPLAEIEPEEFYNFTDTRPLVSIVGAGERAVHWPHGEFHGATLEHPSDLVLFVAPEPNLRWRSFAALLLDVLQRFEVQNIVCIGSIFGAVPHRAGVRMTGFANEPTLRAALEKHKVMFTNYEGPTASSRCCWRKRIREVCPRRRSTRSRRITSRECQIHACRTRCSRRLPR